MTNPNNCDFLDIVFKTLRLLAYKFVCHNGDDIRAAGTWELNAVGESMDETIQRIRKNLSRMKKNLQLLEQKTGCIEAASFICTTSSVVIPQYKRRFTGFVGRPLTLARNPESDSDLEICSAAGVGHGLIIPPRILLSEEGIQQSSRQCKCKTAE